MVTGNDIWENLFAILKGNVPDEMTEEVCEQLAGCLHASDRFAFNALHRTQHDSATIVKPKPAEPIVQWAADEITALRSLATTPSPDASPDSGEVIRDALSWYGEQARLARLIHSEGDAGRHALAADGGKRARAALGMSDD